MIIQDCVFIYARSQTILGRDLVREAKIRDAFKCTGTSFQAYLSIRQLIARLVLKFAAPLVAMDVLPVAPVELAVELYLIWMQNPTTFPSRSNTRLTLSNSGSGHLLNDCIHHDITIISVLLFYYSRTKLSYGKEPRMIIDTSIALAISPSVRVCVYRRHLPSVK